MALSSLGKSLTLLSAGEIPKLKVDCLMLQISRKAGVRVSVTAHHSVVVFLVNSNRL